VEDEDEELGGMEAQAGPARKRSEGEETWSGAAAGCGHGAAHGRYHDANASAGRRRAFRPARSVALQPWRVHGLVCGDEEMRY
jgi:hypothetical protein